MVFGGDFRQCLPVVQRASRLAIVAASLRRSCIWHSILQLYLCDNMRLRNDPESRPFAEYLLRVGDGNEPAIEDEVYIGGDAPPSVGRTTALLPDITRVSSQEELILSSSRVKVSRARIHQWSSNSRTQEYSRQQHKRLDCAAHSW